MSARSDFLRAESQALAELARLQRDPVYWGRGVPRGDGRLVLVIPGLFGNDLYLQPLHLWLRRMGYRTVRSSLSVNAGCPDRLRTQVEGALRRRMITRPGPVAVVGHSRGGMLAWALAGKLRATVSHVVLLASPAPATVALFRSGATTSVPANVANSAVVDAGTRALRLLDPHCTVPACGCPYVQDIRGRLDPDTKVLAISSRDDQVVAPGACMVPEDEGTNLVIGGTHSGIVYNRAAYPALARFLAS